MLCKWWCSETHHLWLAKLNCLQRQGFLCGMSIVVLVLGLVMYPMARIGFNAVRNSNPTSVNYVSNPNHTSADYGSPVGTVYCLTGRIQLQILWSRVLLVPARGVAFGCCLVHTTMCTVHFTLLTLVFFSRLDDEAQKRMDAGEQLDSFPQGK